MRIFINISIYSIDFHISYELNFRFYLTNLSIWDVSTTTKKKAICFDLLSLYPRKVFLMSWRLFVGQLNCWMEVNLNQIILPNYLARFFSCTLLHKATGDTLSIRLEDENQTRKPLDNRIQNPIEYLQEKTEQFLIFPTLYQVHTKFIEPPDILRIDLNHMYFFLVIMRSTNNNSLQKQLSTVVGAHNREFSNKTIGQTNVFNEQMSACRNMISLVSAYYRFIHWFCIVSIQRMACCTHFLLNFFYSII